MEFLAGIPLLAFVLLAGWQIVLAGHTWWKVGEAARIAARDGYVGTRGGSSAAGLKRARTSADALLSSSPRREVRALTGGEMRVSAELPLVAPLRLALGHGPMLSSTSRFER